MTRPLPRPVRTWSSVWSLPALLFLSTPVVAQGTVEQREACTEDAIRLCSDTIPDVARTTVCMKAHGTQLSPRCRRVVFAESETLAPAAVERPRRAARASRPGEDDLDRPRSYRRRAQERAPDYASPRRAAPRGDDEYEAPRRVAPSYDEGYYEPRHGYDEGYYEPRRVAPVPDEGYYQPRRFAPGPDEGYYDRPSAQAAPEPYQPYVDGYAPRRYLYSGPQGLTESPYD